MKKLVSFLLTALVLAVLPVGCAKESGPKLPPARWGVKTAADTKFASYDIVRAYSEADAVCTVTIGNWIDESKYVSRYEAEIEKVFKGAEAKPGDTVKLNYSGSSWQDHGAPLPIYGTKALVFLYANEGYGGFYECRAAAFFYETEYEGRTYLVDLIGSVGYNTINKNRETGLKNRYSPALRSGLAERVRNTDPELADAIDQREAGPGRNGLKIFLYDDIESLLYSMREY